MLSKQLLAVLFLLPIAFQLHAPAPAAAAPPVPWTGNYPASGAVTIPAGETVILDTNVTLTSLTIDGELICAAKDLAASANWIAVHGLLQCGTAANPFTNSFNITLTGSNPDENVMGMGTKFLGAMAGGRIRLHGENRKGWTRLAATANKSATQITLKEALPWRAGDRIVIVSTDFRAEHAEERRIESISGKVVTLSAPLNYQHWCATSAYGSDTLEECAEVGLLTRNIVIKGNITPAAAGFGGHVMVMNGASAQIGGVQFLNMGQKGKIARYPMHWHLVGSAPGQYMTNSSIVHSYNRFVSIHGTHDIRLAGNVAYDTIGHGYYLEDGIERGNVIEDNLGALVRNSTDGTPTPSDREASVFWISNPDNIVRRNVSAGSEHTGFWLGFPEHPIGLSTTDAVWPRRTRLREFSGNVSHSNNGRGLFVDGAENPDRTTSVTWYEPRQNPADGNSAIVPPVFNTFTAYKNRFEGVWMRGFSRPVLQSAKLADNWMGTYFASLSGAAGHIQDSLVVGETANKGNPETWEPKGLDGRELPHFWAPKDVVRGLEYYDGPMEIRRTKFANFNSNAQRKAGGITSLSPNPYWVSSLNGSNAISFHNSNKVWLETPAPKNDGDAFSVIRDSDGSITGTPGRRIVPKNPVLYTASCTNMPGWNAYVCPYNYVGVQVNAPGGVDLRGTILKRNDGAAWVLGGAPGCAGCFYMNMIEGRPYSLVLPVAAPKAISFVRFEQAGKAARLSLPYPASPFTVKLWGSPVQKVSSLEALASGGTKYYYDGGTNRLHLRLVSATGGWQEFEVKRP